MLRKPCLSALSACLLSALSISGSAAAAEGLGQVQFNQHWISDQHRQVDVTDPQKILREVFAQVPDEAMVWPTENYYYFSFTANGRDYAGNFRLHPEEREEGLINFAYFDRSDPSWFRHLLLGPDDGVALEKLSDLDWTMTLDGRSVTFRMNTISQAPPAPGLLSPQERFVGRTFDESGVRFLLVFHDTQNRFLWLLDPVQAKETKLVKLSPNLDIHVGSGFVFHRGESGRLALVGVNSAEIVRNTYYDGPFDQLADNWLPETQFKEFAERSEPGIVGQINRRGEFKGQEARMAVMPYIQYRMSSEVWDAANRCEAAIPALTAYCIVETARHFSG